MNFLEFKKRFEIFPVISVVEIKKSYPDFDHRRLVEWQQKGYLIKLKRGYYCFTDKEKNEHFIRYTANKIYTPSYISLESALAFYNLIPEDVFITTSLTTRNTTKYSTAIGDFEYRHIKPALFFGYRLIQKNKVTIKMAEVEKAILDFFYMNKLNDLRSIEQMRFDRDRIAGLLDFNKLNLYLKVFDSIALTKRINRFKKVINA